VKWQLTTHGLMSSEHKVVSLLSNLNSSHEWIHAAPRDAPIPTASGNRKIRRHLELFQDLENRRAVVLEARPWPSRAGEIKAQG
jgi:hypothetical protein